MPRTRRLDRELSWPCPPAFARIQRRIARGAIEGDACLDPIENEGVALGPGDANVGLGIDFKIDCAAVATFAVDDRAGALPAPLPFDERVIDEDPVFEIGEDDRSSVPVP